MFHNVTAFVIDDAIICEKILNVHFFEVIRGEAFIHRKSCKSTPPINLLYKEKAKGNPRSIRLVAVREYLFMGFKGVSPAAVERTETSLE